MYDGTLHDESHDGSPALSWAEVDAAEPPFTLADFKNLPAAQLTRRPLEPASSAGSMRKRSAEILENLADVLKCILFKEDLVCRSRSQSLPASHPYGRLDENARKNFPRTMAARIVLSTLYAQLDKNKPSPASQYLFVRILVHEVGHVLNTVIHGLRRREVFYQDSCTNETGFELENALFGGTCEPHDLSQCFFPSDTPTPTPVLLMEQWPSPRI